MQGLHRPDGCWTPVRPLGSECDIDNVGHKVPEVSQQKISGESHLRGVLRTSPIEVWFGCHNSHARIPMRVQQLVLETQESTKVRAVVNCLNIFRPAFLLIEFSRAFASR